MMTCRSSSFKGTVLRRNKKYSFQRTALWERIKAAVESEIPEFEEYTRTYRNWSEGVLNAFKNKYTNGPTGGLY
jgi:transposase